MKRIVLAFAVILIVICMASCVAAEETDLISRIRNANRIQWASQDYVILDGEMIRVSDRTVLFETVYNVASTGDYIWIETADGLWIIEKNGNSRLLEIGSDVYVYGKCGVFWGWPENGWEDDSYRSFVYDPAADSFVMLSDSKISDVYQDPDGQVYILTQDNEDRTCGIYKANGEQVLKEGKYEIAVNCNYDALTNNHLTAYDQTYSAVILSPFTGKAEACFPGFTWMNYDENHDIYRDNTALIGPEGFNGYGKRVIGLDGMILKELPDDHYFCNRGESSDVYGIGSLSADGVYNWITDRTYWYEGEYNDPVQYITCEETGEIFKGTVDENEDITEYQSMKTGKFFTWDELVEDGEPIPERYEKYRPVQKRMYWPVYTEEGLRISAPDGTILGDGCWVYFPWEPGKEMIEGYHLFEEVPVCACVDQDNFVAVINTKGETILPAEYEQIDLIGSFSDDPKANGYCLAAKKNDQWYIFNINGELLYADADS